ncbi:MAG: lytic transglycosylase domain-containing protein [Clostridiaceae bacterium]
MKLKKYKILFIIIILLIFTINIKNIFKISYPDNYKEYVEIYSDENKIDSYFVFSVIKAESNFDKDAKSSKDAYGLMQITDSTAAWICEEMGIEGYENEMLYDPEFNIKLGCWYIKNLSSEFDGDPVLVLAAYNGGRTNVNKWLLDESYSKNGKTLDVIPFKETDKYINKVKVNYSMYKWIYKSN